MCEIVGHPVTRLVRTRIGPFAIEEAVSLERLEQAVEEGRLEELLLPPAAAVAHLPAVSVGESERERLLHGMRVDWPSSTHFVGTRAPLPILDKGRGAEA